MTSCSSNNSINGESEEVRRKKREEKLEKRKQKRLERMAYSKAMDMQYVGTCFHHAIQFPHTSCYKA